jgi:hypothetical protein
MFYQIKSAFLNQKFIKSVLTFVYTILMVFAFSSSSIVSQMVGLLTISCLMALFTFDFFDDMDTKHVVSTISGLLIPLFVGLGSFILATKTKAAIGNVELAALALVTIIHFFWLGFIIMEDGNKRLAIRRRLSKLFPRK